MSAPLCFIDTETDGVYPSRRVWEVALIRRTGFGADRSLSLFVELNLTTADPFGLSVGRFYERHPLGCWLSGRDQVYPLPWEDVEVDPPEGAYVTPEVAARQVARWTHGAHLIGAVPNFDAEVLGALLRHYGLTPAWHYHLVDVEAMVVGYLYGKGAEFVYRDGTRGGLQPPWSSEELSRVVGVALPSEEERHTAMGDVLWAQRLYDAMTAG